MSFSALQLRRSLKLPYAHICQRSRPKAGLAILSACTPSQFALAVATGDSKAFTKIKGIGTKIAQRIVLELKDKVAKENTISVRGNGAQGFAAVPSGAVEEAVTALVVLGYTEGEAMSVISKLDLAFACNLLQGRKCCFAGIAHACTFYYGKVVLGMNELSAK